MKQLSQATQETAHQVRERIAAVTRGVARGHAVMQQIATLDLSQNIVAKERINALLAAIATQHETFGVVLADTAAETSALASTVGEMITGLQFQDRTKQHLAQVVDTLAALRDGSAQLQEASVTALPELATGGGLDEAAIGRIIDKQTLGGMRSRLLSRLLASGGTAQNDVVADDDAGGDVELF